MEATVIGIEYTSAYAIGTRRFSDFRIFADNSRAWFSIRARLFFYLTVMTCHYVRLSPHEQTLQLLSGDNS